MTQTHKSSAGFTLIELTLSMAFIAMLLLAIALLTLQISGIYNKGLTTRAVNEAGQLISADMQRTLNTSNSDKVNFVFDTPTTGGRLCTDTVVYAWNYGGHLTNGFNTFTSFGPVTAEDSSRPIRFVKLRPAGNGALKASEYCVRVAGVYPGIPVSANDLLEGGDVQLAVHYFDLVKGPDGQFGHAVSGDDSQRLYSVSLTIGTNEKAIIDSNVNVDGGTQGCKTPGNTTDNQYCGINNFTFIARAGNSNE